MVPIVGIGASAGGLEALELFLSHVPAACGMAFVVVQHLAPDHIGMLPELLQRITRMKVTQVRDAVRVSPDCVYVIPPNKDISIRDRILYLQAPVEAHGLRLPINSFLISLAEDCAELGIGVILSGMGSDGSLGLKAVKEQGGLTLAQEPATASFDSMPQNAIATGCADIIAPPDEMPGLIMDFLRCASPKSCPDHGVCETDQTLFGKITTLIKAKTRHDFSLYKTNSVYRRVERRMGIHKIDSLAGYYRFLQKNPAEIELLFKELLIGVTSFFRDPAAWEELKRQALPKILSAYPEGGVLRAWSCGCSTGEEAYSLAILFKEALDQVERPERYTLQIFATDLDSDAVEKARKGLYSTAIEADLSPERLQRFFSKEEHQYRVCRDIREMATFAIQNVAMDPPFTKLDILVCRNVLIYMTSELQQRLMPLFHYSLNSGGLLFLGSAETVNSQSGLFLPATTRSKFFWCNKGSLYQERMVFPLPISANSPVSAVQESLMPKTTDNLQQLADQLILQYFSTPTVLVNDQGDVVYISGRTGKYLEPATGKANMNIFAMAREGLRYELGTVFHQALQQHEPVKARVPLVVSDNGTQQTVDLTLLRIKAPEALQGMVLIAFKDVAAPPKTRRRKNVLSDNKPVEELDLELLKCREQLRSAREEMQSSQEEMKSMNEELQSTNEELQSTNEELTTSKEELQSMNEELQTVNAEQSARLDDFMRVSNDMENLLNSTEIVTVFLDNQLQVRRFTSGANRLFKLIPGDLGRPLTDIVSNLDYPQLYDHVQDVLRKLVSVENQVATLDGRWFLVRIMPYRTMDKKIDGVVITCNDITEAKKTEDQLREDVARLSSRNSG